MMTRGLLETTFTQYQDGAGRPVEGVVPEEEAVSLYVNGPTLVTLMCTPTMLEELALGFLLNEGLIAGLEEVAAVWVCANRRCVDVWLDHAVDAPAIPTITSGCSGGTTFEDLVEIHHRLDSDLRVSPEQIAALMQKLADAAELYRSARGVHTSALADGERLRVVAEDVGRHNTLDKIAGACLRRSIQTRDHILLTTGRVSSEMLNKAARMGVPVVVSRTSPTSLSVQLAHAWGVTLVGYARGWSFHIYAGEERIR